MKTRTIWLATLLVGAFILITSRSRWDFSSVLRPLASTGKAWSEPQVARGAGLSSDELNNIEIYKMAREATVYITSTTYRRNWFMEVYPVKDLGSGFLINEKGWILTNYHVVSGSNQVEVTLLDGSIHKAEVLVRDRQEDLALCRIELKKKAPFLHLADSDHLQVGQKVLAIGNPFGLDGTLTTGVLSALHRNIQSENNSGLEDMIQTDAAINSGNSGGPLLDSQGNVIGINTAILGQQNIGIGFATPINKAKVMLDDYQAGRSFQRPRLGISVVFIPAELASALDLPAESGLLVQEVGRGTSADDAGMRGARQAVYIGNQQIGVGGDYITAIDGKPVTNNEALSRALQRKRPGDVVDLKIYRGKRSLSVRVKLSASEERL